MLVVLVICAFGGHVCAQETVGDYMLLGLKLGKSNKINEAILEFSKAIEINPYYDYSYCERGLAYLYKGDLKLALSDLNKSIELNPSQAEAYNNRSVVFLAQKNFEKALEDASQAIALRPNYDEAYVNRGLAYHRLKREDQAIADDSKAMELNPKMIKAYLNRMSIYFTKGDLDHALSDINSVIELNPRYYQAYMQRAKIHYKKGDLKRAIADLDLAIELKPDFAEAYYFRAGFYNKEGELDQSTADLNKAIQLNPQMAKTMIIKKPTQQVHGQVNSLTWNDIGNSMKSSVFWIIVGVFGLIALIVIYIQRKIAKLNKTLLDALNARKVKSNTWSFVCGGKPVFIYTFGGGQNTAPRVSIYMTGNFNGRCLISKPGALDKFSEKISSQQGFSDLDPDLRERFFIACEDFSFVKALFRDATVKDLIDSVLRVFTHIEIVGNTCGFVKLSAMLTSLKPDQYMEAAQKLSALMAYLPKTVESRISMTPVTDKILSKARVWHFVSLGFAFAGLVTWQTTLGGLGYQALSPWNVFIGSLWGGVPALILMFYLAWRHLGRFSFSVRALIPSMVIGGLGLLVCVWILTNFLNGYLDKSIETKHVVHIVNKHIFSSSRSADHYYVTVSSGEGEHSFDVQVSRSDYNCLSTSNLGVIWTKRGFFGYEWISLRRFFTDE